MENQNTHVVQWLNENREDSYVSEAGRDKRLASIFMVPITLKVNDVVFTPQAISLGPYHFLKPHLAEMESDKSQIIARAVMRNLPSDFFAPLQKVRDGKSLPVLRDDNFLGSVVTRCRGYYGDAQFLRNLNEEAFAMMLFRDASFLLRFLEDHLDDPQQIRKSGQPQQQRASGNGNFFHDLKSATGLWLAVKMDIIKFENQIPLPALESLYAFIGNPNQCFKDFVAKICSKYSPLNIQHGGEPDLGTHRHLLHCVHATVYKKPPERVVQGTPSGEHSTGVWSPFTWLNNICLWVRGNNSNEGYARVQPKEARLRNYAKTALHSASELSKAGVKFRRCEGGIEQIRFDEAQSTLYLPQLRISIMTETIIRNLIAFELCSPEIEQKAVTGFTRLLKELTQDAKDADVLRRNEIFANLGVGDEKMVEIVKGLSSSTWNPYCKPVNVARVSLEAYYSRSTLRILWNEFLETYCSKPWVLISALAATLLLVMTAVQVFCLFYTCNKNS
ncbi:uncharacterized protein LOC131034445 [Cryptomeria japonica]|uniref:uncharacterized protein LOC131034445 n=1 Tax=Cryptomeria japonica TaxID=3369 RepID=UPI0025AB70B2|nr:uncharacterized protein LOC131034445 [Cryptomeria japonica]